MSDNGQGAFQNKRPSTQGNVVGSKSNHVNSSSNRTPYDLVEGEKGRTTLPWILNGISDFKLDSNSDEEDDFRKKIMLFRGVDILVFLF